MLFSFYEKSIQRPLTFLETLLQSVTRLQQGYPIGPALFSLGVDKASRLQILELNAGYLDDATLGGTAENVSTDLPSIISRVHQVVQ